MTKPSIVALGALLTALLYSAALAQAPSTPLEPSAPLPSAAVGRVVQEAIDRLAEKKSQEALAAATKAVAAARQAKDIPGEALALEEQGRAHQALGNIAEAVNAWRGTAAAWAKVKEGPGRVEALALAGLALMATQPKESARLFDECLALAGNEPVRPITMSTLLYQLGAALYRQSRTADAKRFLGKALEMRERLTPGSLELASLLNDLGVIAIGERDLATAAAYNDRAIAIKETAAPDSLDLSISLTNGGNIALQQGRGDRAKQYITRAVAIQQKHVKSEEQVAGVLAGNLNNLGILALREGQLDQAEQFYRQALELKEKVAAESLDVALTVSNLSELFAKQGKPEPARQFAQRALELRKKLAPESTEVASSLNALGDLALGNKNLPEAKQWFEEALQIVQKQAPDSMQMVAVRNNLGRVALQQGRLDDAVIEYEQALAAVRRVAKDSDDEVAILDNLGGVLRRQGRVAQASERLQQALAIKEKSETDSPDVAETLSDLGSLARELGDPERARTWFERSRKIREQKSPGSPELADTLDHLGALALDAGDLPAADGYITGALAIREGRSPDALATSFTRLNAGELALQRGDFRGARERFQKAREAQERLAPSSLALAAALSGLGDAAMGEGQAPAAVTLYQAALEIRQRLAPGSASEAANLSRLGHAALATRDFAKARDLFGRAVRDLEALPRQAAAASTSILPGTRPEEAFSGLLQASVELNDGPGAFAAIEHDRAYHLRELLAGRPAARQQAATDPLRQRREELEGKRTQLYRTLAALDPAKDDERIGAARKELEELGRQQQALAAELRQASPALAGLEYPEPLDLEAARKHLQPGTLLLAYAVGGKETVLVAVAQPSAVSSQQPALSSQQPAASSQAGAGHVASAAVAIFRISAGTAELERRVGEFRRAIADKGAVETPGRELYDLLVRPAQALVLRSERVVLSPDAPLHHLPFGALVAGTTSAPAPAPAAKQPEAAKKASPKPERRSRGRRGRKPAPTLPKPTAAPAATRPAPAVAAHGPLYLAEMKPLDVITSVTFSAAVEKGSVQGSGFRVQGSGGTPPASGGVTSGTESPATTGAADMKRPASGPGAPPANAAASPATAKKPIAGKPAPSATRKSPTLASRSSRAGSGRANKSSTKSGSAPRPKAQGPTATPSHTPTLPHSHTASPGGRPSSPSLLAFGDEGARREIEAIARLYPQPVTHLAAEATEGAVEKEAPAARVLHLACRTLLDPKDPAGSALLLTKGGATPANDGQFQAWEILERLRLNAELVVLSACGPAPGQPAAGEGVLLLPSAFQVAGAQSVLATLWPVSEPSTASLMYRFHQALRKGLPKDEALQQAIAGLRSNAQVAHPYFWAGFYLTGSNAPLGK